MNLLTIGLNHKKTPVALREQAAFAPHAVRPALRDLTAAQGVSEAAILSTCNRTEIYCGQHDDEQQIFNWFGRHTGFSRSQLAGCLYHFANEQAVKHAFRVASGLDSMVIGEPQILGQMKSAFHTAVDVGTVGKVLNRLFQHTFTVAKQVRTNTAIGANSVSIAYIGVNLAKQIFTHLNEQTVLLIGAGETIELMARHLKENKVQQIIIANRSLDKAQALVKSVGCRAITLAEIPNQLPWVDIVVSCTASTLPILGKGAVERALENRRQKHKPILILDLAVPRDVEAEVSRLRKVHLYNVDDLKSVVQRNCKLRRHAAEQAEHMIDSQVDQFMDWMRSLAVLPSICALRRGLERLQQEEADKAMRKIRNGEDAQVVVQQLARGLANKFAHHPSQVLKQAHLDGNAELLVAAHKLFGC